MDRLLTQYFNNTFSFLPATYFFQPRKNLYYTYGNLKFYLKIEILSRVWFTWYVEELFEQHVETIRTCLYIKQQILNFSG